VTEVRALSENKGFRCDSFGMKHALSDLARI
jgi:hypothetical protein